MPCRKRKNWQKQITHLPSHPQWTALKAHLICCDPLVVALSNNLKSKKYYLSKFHSNTSGKWGKMAHVIFDLLFSNENYAQRATSSVQAYFIEKTDKRMCERREEWGRPPASQRWFRLSSKVVKSRWCMTSGVFPYFGRLRTLSVYMLRDKSLLTCYD